MLTFYKVVIYILLFTCNTLLAQNSEYVNFTIKDGLPSNEVYHVFQDSKGYIWFATDMGVSRYDGNEFYTYDMDNGLPDNTVFEIYEDYKGRLWFIPFSSKLSYLENDSIVLYPHSSKISEVILSRLFPIKKSFYVDTNDDVYISIYGEGILKILKNGTIERLLYSDDPEKRGTYFIYERNFLSGSGFE